MDSERWRRVQDLFHAAADLPPAEWPRFLAARCPDDSALSDDVLRLLRADARGASILDQGVARAAEQILLEPIAPPPFRQFRAYRILRELGQGGMATVYLAQRDDLGTQVAIKILRDAHLSPARRERFDLEQRTLAQLDHPCIARLYDANSSADGTPFFVMEYVEGVPLTEHCRQRRCSLAERLKLFRAVCEAVLYAHRRAVIHRDLKPANILVKPDGTLRLLDFGIAKHLDSLECSTDLTVTGLRLMTPAYAAPEQIRGEPVGIQADVYALGVILYQLLTGRLPVDLSGRTPSQSEQAVTRGMIERPSVAACADDSPVDLPEKEGLSRATWADLDVLCLTALHRDVERRYPSVEALLRDIDHYLHSEPLEARPDSVPYRLRKFVARHRAAVLATAAAAAASVGLVTAFTIRLAHARNVAVAESVRAHRIERFMTNLFQDGDAAAGIGDNLRAVTLLDRGAREAQALDADPEAQADLYETLGLLYQKLGRFDRADSLLRGALEVRRRSFGADSAQAAASLIDLGLLRAQQARLPEAEQLVREGLATAERVLPAGDPAIARSMAAVGRVLAQRGRYDPAIELLEEAVRRDSAAGASPSDLAASLSALASAHYFAGHYAAADRLYRRTLDIDRELHGGHHPSVARDLIDLASIQQDLGYYSQAEVFSRQALAITEPYYGTKHPDTADDLTVLGRALLYQKKYDEAERALSQALDIRERLLGRAHPDVADTLNELGEIASLRGDFATAGARFERVVDIYRSVYGDHHYLVAIGLSNVAYNDLNEKRYAQAERLFREVVARFTETLSADNVNTGIARIKLGRTILREGRFDEAERETKAGYEILARQTDPSISYLRAAREDLAAERKGMNGGAGGDAAAAPPAHSARAAQR